MSRTRIRWRVIIRVGENILYANRDVMTPLPKVRWFNLSAEYPDHFTEAEANQIRQFYSDQGPYLQKVRLVVEEEDA